jgi:hypothetical protein
MTGEVKNDGAASYTPIYAFIACIGTALLHPPPLYIYQEVTLHTLDIVREVHNGCTTDFLTMS